METIKHKAQTYESKQVNNIAELDKVDIGLEVIEGKYNEGKEDEFVINTIEVDGEKYRVPVSVLKSLKAILEIKPDLKTFKVTKTGQGMQTEYTVIPLE